MFLVPGQEAVAAPAIAKAIGPCATAINAGDRAVINVKCSYASLPKEQQKLIDDLVLQVQANQVALANQLQLNRLTNQRLESLSGRLDALEQTDNGLRNQLAAPVRLVVEEAAVEGASEEVKSAAASLERGDVGPAIRYLGNRVELAKADANSNLRTASTLLAQQAALLQTRSLTEANEAAERAVELDPTNDAAIVTAAGLAQATGNIAQALGYQKRALANARNRLAKQPDDLLRQRDLAVMLGILGNMYFTSGNVDSAEANFSESLGILKSIVEHDETNLEWKSMLGIGYYLVSDIKALRGQTSEALDMLNRSFALMTEVAEKFPSDALHYQLLVCHKRFANLHALLGESEDSIASLQNALNILEPLIAAYPQIEQGYIEQVQILLQVSNVRLSNGQIDDAIKNYRLASQIAEERSGKDTSNFIWQSLVASVYGGLGDAQLSRPMMSPADVTLYTGEALASYTASYDIASGIAAHDPENQSTQYDLWFALTRLGRVRMARGEFMAALGHFERGVVILEGMIERTPDVALYYRQLGMTKGLMGNTLLMQGRQAEALEKFTLALELSQKAALLAPEVVDFRRDIATNYSMIGQIQWMAGDYDLAMASTLATLGLRREIAEADPANGLWEVELFNAYLALATLQVAHSADPIEALKAAYGIFVRHRDSGRMPVMSEIAASKIEDQLSMLGASLESDVVTQ